MTIVLAVVLVRLKRLEHRREAARVALLREMADQATDEAAEDIYVDDAPEIQLREPIDVAPSVAAADLFVPSEAQSAWPRRAAVAAAIVGVIVAGVFVLRSTRTVVPSSAGTPSPSVPSSPAGTPPPASAPTASAASTQPAGLLELLSLKQTQDAGSLTITGLVQNPRAGAALSKVVATALVFGPDGTFLASGRAPLDFTVLRPGDESPFVIKVPVDTPVARYRVGFRSEDGHVIGHIDRRTTSTLATGTADASIMLRARGAS